jgi:hypothetical protein
MVKLTNEKKHYGKTDYAHNYGLNNFKIIIMPKLAMVKLRLILN